MKLPPSIVAISRSAAGFLRWWVGELKACLPERVRSWFAPSQDRVLVELEPELAVISRREGGSWQECGRIRLDPAAPDRADAETASLVAAAGLAGGAAAIRLGPKLALRRKLLLPLAATENLREVLGFEMDRFTPFKAEELWFDYRVLGKDTEAGRVELELVFALRETVADALGRIGSWGLIPTGVAVAAPDRSDHADPLPVDDVASGTSRAPSWALSAVMAGVFVLLVAGAAYLPLLNKQRVLEAHEARFDRLRAEALVADQLREELSSRVKTATYLFDRKRARPPAVALLAEVTRLLPDDAWLLQFRLHGGELLLSGYAASASGLVERLETSPLLEQVHFGAPVTTDARVGAERFNLLASVEGPPAP